MRAICVMMLAGWMATAVLAAEPAPVQLVPGVSEVQWASALDVQGPGCIILADQASSPERVAAQMLARYVEKRFGQRWITRTAKDIPANARLCIYLGQVSSFPTLAKLCEAERLSVPTQPEGYALKVWARGDKITAVVAGQNGRGVIYGQDTLFQLFGKRADQLTLQTATIRDWPSIPLRGRPHPHYQYFFKDANFDCIMTSRINFIDLRDGIYAFEPGAKLKHEEMSPIIKKAKDRGLRIYAVVNCGVPADQQDAVIALFKEFIALGTDGLWASFDDRGSGEDPEEMVARIIGLGRQHGITGDAIAITPPKGDYQVIKTEFNRKIANVPGMEQAVWYWTSVPCAEDAADGEEIGLRVRPSWWHNWPRLTHPSLHAGGGGYVPFLDMADGWNHPTDRELTEMGQYVHAVMPWDGWQAQQHYLVPSIGWWSWRPEQYDFQAIRRRAYDMVFGPDGVETAAAFDDLLNDVQDRFQYWSTQTDFAPHCPPRLKSLGDRSRTVADLEALKADLTTLQKSAASASLLDNKLVQDEYLAAMAREIKTGLAAAQAPYPEYWYPEYQDKILRAIYAQDLPQANQLIEAVSDRILKEVTDVEAMLDNPGRTKRYAAWWQKRAKAKAADLQELLAKRQAQLKERVAIYNKTVAPIKQMLSGVNDPPVQLGTGAWVRHNHLLATVLPEPHETFWGDWIGGLYEQGDLRAAVFALEKHLRVNAGVHTELPVNIPVPSDCQRDRLALLIYLADANKESFGLGRAKWRWAGYRTIRLFWKDQEIWQADIGIPRLTGQWFPVPLPTLPADLDSLDLRLRIEDYHNAKNSLEIVYVGPLHLIELDRD